MLANVDIALIVVVVLLAISTIRMCHKVRVIEQDLGLPREPNIFCFACSIIYSAICYSCSAIASAKLPKFPAWTTSPRSAVKTKQSTHIEVFRKSKKCMKDGSPDSPTDTTCVIDIYPLPDLPDEVLWEIFAHFLVITQWVGWINLVLLNNPFQTALLTKTDLINRTLIPIHGGLTRTVEWLMTKHTAIRPGRKTFVETVLDSVLSSIRYDKNQDLDLLKGEALMWRLCSTLPNVQLYEFAQSVYQGYGFSSSAWEAVIGHMKAGRSSRPREYQQ
ncbi:hypothetical protein HDV00_003331 [Rhizophlyctis rosea]|nr:hypothetical protein HDV00_003331 [Rhizophlyctis rosea]